jgi:hypothetical protein
MTGIKSKVVIAGVAALTVLCACSSGSSPAGVTQTFTGPAPTAPATQPFTPYSETFSTVSPTATVNPSAAAEKSAAAREKKAAAARAHAIHLAIIARENTLISATLWDEVIRNPDNYEGDIYTISGTVAEYNINSNTLATQESAALVAVDGNGNDFVVEAPASVLGNAQPGDTFTAKVTVLGAEEAENTVYGGTSEVPDFDASTFTITG